METNVRPVILKMELGATICLSENETRILDHIFSYGGKHFADAVEKCLTKELDRNEITAMVDRMRPGLHQAIDRFRDQRLLWEGQRKLQH